MTQSNNYDLFVDPLSGADRLVLARMLAERRIRTTGDTRAAPGFATISVDLEAAIKFSRELADAGVIAIIVDERYRTPCVSLDSAVAIAVEATDRIKTQRFLGETFAPSRFLRESAMWWTFFAPSESLVAKGHVPGGVLCLVDKSDGSIVDGATQERAYQLMNAWRSPSSVR